MTRKLNGAIIYNVERGGDGLFYSLDEWAEYYEENKKPVYENGQIVAFMYPNGTIHYIEDDDLEAMEQEVLDEIEWDKESD